MENPREFERLLRDAGLSSLQAKRLMSGGYEALNQKRDADGQGELEAIQTLMNNLRSQS